MQPTETIPAAGSRGVFGFSSGGFGAWNLGSRNPEVFGALAMLWGDSFLDMGGGGLSTGPGGGIGRGAPALWSAEAPRDEAGAPG